MSILTQNLSNLRGPDINSNLESPTKFFLNALQFRDENSCDLETCNFVESEVINSLSALVLKLSETNFRPLYYKLFDWAVRS